MCFPKNKSKNYKNSIELITQLIMNYVKLKLNVKIRQYYNNINVINHNNTTSTVL